LRPPDPEAGPLRGCVVNLDRPVIRKVPPDPLAVVVAERGAVDDREQLLAEAGDGEVALDPTARVEHLRVGDLADVAGDLVVAQPLDVGGGAGAADLHLRERALVEYGSRLPASSVLGADRR